MEKNNLIQSILNSSAKFLISYFWTHFIKIYYMFSFRDERISNVWSYTLQVILSRFNNVRLSGWLAALHPNQVINLYVIKYIPSTI